MLDRLHRCEGLMTAPRQDGRPLALAGGEIVLLRGALAGLGVIGSIVLARALGPEGRGIYSLVLTAAGLCISIGKLGLEQASVFLLGSGQSSAHELAGQNGLLSVTAAPVGVVVMAALPLALPEVFGEIPSLLLVLATISIPLSMHTQLSAGLVTLLGRPVWQFRAAVGGGLLHTTLLLWLFWIQRLDVIAGLAANLCALLATWALTVSGLDSGERMPVRWDARLLQATLRQALVLHLGMILFSLHLRMDIFFVKGIAGTHALGIYSLAVTLAETVLFLPDSLAVAVLPRLIGNRLDDAARYSLQAARVNCLLSGTAATVWIVLGQWLIPLCFGPAFAPAYLPVIGLLPGMLFLSMQRVCGGPTLRSGMPGRLVLIYGISLACNAALNWWWIPRWGPTGAGLASSVSYGLGAVLFLQWTARLGGVSFAAAMLPTRRDVELCRDAGRLGWATLRRGSSLR